VSITDRPLFTGHPHGEDVDKDLKAVSVVQVFEYTLSTPPLEIVDDLGNRVALDYQPDQATNTVNLHLWAQIENESGMDELMANAHSKMATQALVNLFRGLNMVGQHALWTDGLYQQQFPMPNGVRFVELMTLGERFAMKQQRDHTFRILCVGKTCGAGGNLYIQG
jgi:hypothetical protein